uniref:Fibronectin type-III domain-containing protein n=1 Tax=Panagrellus redivivus TaxID=6233 RepID=A0A7E4URP2_PANRE
MPPVDIACLQNGYPPQITTFFVADVGDTYAILQWTTPPSKQRAKFMYEINYNILDDADATMTKLMLPSAQKLILLKGLEQSTNYTSNIFGTNNCANGPANTLVFETRKTVLHPAVTHVMPHEIILTLIVFFIWAMILRHFFIIYNRLSFVNPLGLGGYLTQKGAVASRSTSRASSQHTLISKESVNNQFNILENAVCHWRSETLLSGFSRRLSENSAPTQTAENGLAARVQRYSQIENSTQQKSSASLYNNARSSYSSGPIIMLTTAPGQPTEPPGYDDANFEISQIPKNSARSYYSEGAEPNGHSSTAPAFSPLLNCAGSSIESNETDDEISKTPTPSPIQNGHGKNPSEITRKISEVLLGKATTDIRRYSLASDGERERREKEERPPSIKRRKTIFSNFNTLRMSLRQSRAKPRKCKMESVKEEREITPGSIDTKEAETQTPKSKESTALLHSTYIGSTDNNYDQSEASYITAKEVILRVGGSSDDETD